MSVSMGGLTAGVGVTSFTGGVGVPAGGVGVTFASILGGVIVGFADGTGVIFTSTFGGAWVGAVVGKMLCGKRIRH